MAAFTVVHRHAMTDAPLVGISERRALCRAV